MKVTDITPGRRSPAERLRKQTRSVLPASGPTTRIRRRSRAVRSAARDSRLRQADWGALGTFALSLTTPPRRRPDPKLVVGATGALGAGAAAAVVARKRSGSSELTDRDAGGPTSADSPSSETTGSGQGTKGNLQFEPHS